MSESHKTIQRYTDTNNSAGEFSIDLFALPEHPELAAQVREGAQQAADVDGVAPLSEQFLLGLDDVRLGHRHLVIRDAPGRVMGAAAVDDASAELFIAPDFRRHGHGERLYQAVQAEFAPGEELMPVWAHGNGEGAQALAAKLGLRINRHLLVMAICGAPLRDAAAAEVQREGFVFVDYAESQQRWAGTHGDDFVDTQWVTVNNEAFSWHPEQGGWDLARLRRGMEAAWFDPHDVVLMWHETEPQLAGFHWTKWHGMVAQGESTPQEVAQGEIYVVGLANAYRGQGLGSPLLSAGLRRQVERGAQKVILYVEADNEPAVKAYERLGFDVEENHVVYVPVATV